MNRQSSPSAVGEPGKTAQDGGRQGFEGSLLKLVGELQQQQGNANANAHLMEIHELQVCPRTPALSTQGGGRWRKVEKKACFPGQLACQAATLPC
jgi:hypothetical protein